MVPAIITRRLEGETPEAFIARQDTCRNEANRLGFAGPEKFGSNLFDEDTFEEQVMAKLNQWPVIMVYDFADLADTRDELAERLRAIQAAGSTVISIREFLDPSNPEVPTLIDLRGTDAASMAHVDAFKVWMGLGATEVSDVALAEETIAEMQRLNAENLRLIRDIDALMQSERERKAPEASTEPEPKAAPDWTPEQETLVREWVALKGAYLPAELGKELGIHWAKAKSWIKYAAANPVTAKAEQIPS